MMTGRSLPPGFVVCVYSRIMCEHSILIRFHATGTPQNVLHGTWVQGIMTHGVYGRLNFWSSTGACENRLQFHNFPGVAAPGCPMGHTRFTVDREADHKPLTQHAPFWHTREYVRRFVITSTIADDICVMVTEARQNPNELIYDILWTQSFPQRFKLCCSEQF